MSVKPYLSLNGSVYSFAHIFIAGGRVAVPVLQLKVLETASQVIVTLLESDFGQVTMRRRRDLWLFWLV